MSEQENKVVSSEKGVLCEIITEKELTKKEKLIKELEEEIDKEEEKKKNKDNKDNKEKPKYVVDKNGKVKPKKKKLTKEEKKKKKIIKKGRRHYWWRYLLVFFAGILFPFVLIAGTVVGASTLLTTHQLLSIVGVNPDDIITKDYQDKTIYDIVIDVIEGDIQFDSLGGIRELTPYVDELIETVNIELEKAIGFSFDINELYDVTWDQIGNYIFEEVQSGIKLANILGIDENSNRILIFIGFHKDSNGNPDFNNPRSLGDLINGFETMLDTATIEDLIDVGTSGILYNLRDAKISELATVMNDRPLNQIIDIPEDALPALKYLGNFKVDELSSAIDNATLEDLIDVGTEGLLYNLRDVKITELSEVTKTRPLNQIIDIEDDAFPALKYLGNFPISDLNNALDNATLGDLIPIEAGSPFEHLRDAKLNELDDEIKNLYVKDVITIDESSSSILKYIANYKLSEISTVLETMPLSVALEINEDSPKFLKALADKGANLSNINSIIDTLTIGELVDCEGNMILEAISGATLQTIGNTINNLTLSQVIDLSDPSTPKIFQALANTKLTDLTTVMKNLTLGEMIDCEGNRILEALSDATLDTLGDKVNTLTIGDVVDVDDSNTPKILKSLRNTKLDDLGTAINNLPLGDIIEIGEDSPQLLKILANTTINGLADKINNLTINEVLGSEKVGENIFLKALGGDTKITDLVTAMNDLTFMEVFADSIFEDPNDPSTIKSTWRYLLTDENGNVRDYKIATEVNCLIDNMHRNFSSATLRTLYNDGYITLDSPDVLDKRILGASKILGDYTLSELLELITSIAV